VSRPRFLADEDFRRNIVHAVRRLEPKVVISTVVEEGLSSVSDEEVVQFAADHGWLLVSHDVNTMKSTAEHRIAKGDVVPGLFLVPQSRPTLTVAESLVLIWSASEHEEWRNRVVYLPL